MTEQAVELLVAGAILVALIAFVAIEAWLKVKALIRERNLWFRTAIRTSINADRETPDWKWPPRG